MACIHFYEKPGCINNARQKQWLIQAGHRLIVHDLLQQDWAQHPGKLRWFFGDMPVVDWFNRSAPAIKSGTIVPEQAGEQQAIAWMLADPLLIRRPLLETDGLRMVGFDAEKIQIWLGPASEALTADMEICPKQHSPKACAP